MQNPTRPSRIDGKLTVPLALSGLSVLPSSLFLISSTFHLKSRFHSSAFIDKSRCPSKIKGVFNICGYESESYHSSSCLNIPFPCSFVVIYYNNGIITVDSWTNVPWDTIQNFTYLMFICFCCPYYHVLFIMVYNRIFADI